MGAIAVFVAAAAPVAASGPGLVHPAPSGAPGAGARTPPLVDRYPGAAKAYLVAVNGRPLWGLDPDARHLPASLAKLLTALVLLEDGWDPEARVHVGPRAAAAEGARVGLRAGESLRAADALTALLLRSANDACVALVEHAAGSAAAFRPRLAARARSLGLHDSRFQDPCGFDAPGQYTTARDLLRLADAALRAPEIALRARAVDARIATTAGRELRLRTTNALLGRMPEAIGLKTGYTRGAGRTLIAVAEQGGERAVVVLLGAGPDRWMDASGMLYHALAMARAAPPSARAGAR